jgi:hypothetical protein
MLEVPMPGASLVPGHTAASRRPARDTVPVAAAAGLIRNFLTALDMDGGATTPAMTIARILAERHLAAWGEPCDSAPNVGTAL